MTVTLLNTRMITKIAILKYVEKLLFFLIADLIFF